MAIVKQRSQKGPSSAAGVRKRISDVTARSIAKGTKPLAEAPTVLNVIYMMVVQFCRRILYGADISVRVGVYIIGTTILSVIGDFSKENSTSFFANPDNFLNYYFVKLGWGWTLTLVSIFVGLTSFTTSCGNKDVMRNQGMRMAVGTMVWFTFTTIFEIIEYRSGLCSVTKYLTKAKCAAKGYRWIGFDISGHAFLLIWNNLFILEEAKAYLGWERIKDMLRNEEHKRLSVDLSSGDTSSADATSLSKLKNEQFLHLRSNYKVYTPWVRFVFCLLTMLVTLWDIMLYFTLMHFHITLEKIIGASIAVLTWYFLYRVIYVQSWSPGLPGGAMFKYVTEKKPVNRKDSLRQRNGNAGTNKWSDKDDVPMFMGMPIWKKTPVKDEVSANVDNESDFTKNVRNARKSSIDASTYNLKSRSRSSSRTRMNSASRSSLNSKLW